MRRDGDGGATCYAKPRPCPTAAATSTAALARDHGLPKAGSDAVQSPGVMGNEHADMRQAQTERGEARDLVAALRTLAAGTDLIRRGRVETLAPAIKISPVTGYGV